MGVRFSLSPLFPLRLVAGHRALNPRMLVRFQQGDLHRGVEELVPRLLWEQELRWFESSHPDSFWSRLAAGQMAVNHPGAIPPGVRIPPPELIRLVA